jgi:hypothetical protein
MCSCIDLYFEKLNPGGVLVIEDIPEKEWIDLLIQRLPENTKTKTVDFTERAAIDSRILIAWK